MTHRAVVSGIGRVDVLYGGPYRIVEPVDVLGEPAARKVILFDNTQGWRAIRSAWSDPVTGDVTFENLASDGRELLLVAFDHENEWASPTVRRAATADGERP